MRGKLEADVEIKAEASRFHELLTKRMHHVSNVSGDKVQSCELHHGDWGQVGSIIAWNYFHDGKRKVGKDVIEAVEEEKNLISFRVIEGDVLEEYKAFKYTIQAIPKADKGSVIHWSIEYEKLHEHIPNSHYSLLDFGVALSKDIDEHLMKLPN